MQKNEQPHDEAVLVDRHIGPVASVFTFTAAGSGVGLYVANERLMPALEAIGIDGLWVDAALFVGGVLLLWAAITSKSGVAEPDAVPAEG